MSRRPTDWPPPIVPNGESGFRCCRETIAAQAIYRNDMGSRASGFDPLAVLIRVRLTGGCRKKPPVDGLFLFLGPGMARGEFPAGQHGTCFRRLHIGLIAVDTAAMRRGVSFVLRRGAYFFRALIGFFLGIGILAGVGILMSHRIREHKIPP
ncbi:MAG TPA: hypothetical protein VHW90_04615 [Stellaceae bacterium]|jgi:hypothetical protein|nr:hypothetical protein [Stellaceae bacterium]